MNKIVYFSPMELYILKQKGPRDNAQESKPLLDNIQTIRFEFTSIRSKVSKVAVLGIDAFFIKGAIRFDKVSR